MVIGAVAYFFPGLSHRHKLDVFLTGALLVWLEYWQKAYALDKPVYQYYPLVFLLASLSVSRFGWADAALAELRLIYPYAQRASKPLLLITAISVFTPQYYMLYPAAVLLLLAYIAIVTSLQPQPIVLLCSEGDRWSNSLRLLRIHLERLYGPTLMLVLSDEISDPFCSTDRRVRINEKNSIEFLRHALEHCLVAVFCLNPRNDNMLRALDHALSILSHRRIAVLQDRKCVDSPALPLDVMRVKISFKQLSQTKAQLDSWLRKL